MRDNKKWVVDVAVATVWTSPSSPRHVDQAALSNPVGVREWLSQITHEERLQLCSDNLVQSQVLYGQTVIPIEEQGEWMHVVVPDQPSVKDERGYPGWIPKSQLHALAHEYGDFGQPFVSVTSSTAFLYPDKQTKGTEISFQTRLPFIGESDGWCEVLTPSGRGPQFIQTDNVRILRPGDERRNVTGRDIVRSGEQFLGLPYLWGGMSGFGFDCSGFAYTMYRANGITIPRDASDQSQSGKPVEQECLEPGDLLFFAYEKGKGYVHHVGIYYGDGRMLHSPKTGKNIEVISLPNSPYEEEYWGARRYC